MAKALTVKAIEAMKPGTTRKEVADGGLPGLYLIVQPSGSMVWAVRYRFANRPRKFTIGAYPAFTLAMAREAGATALRAVTEGRDPGEERAAREAARPASLDLVPAVLDDFVKRHVKRHNRPSTIKNTEGFIDRTIKPEWANRDIKTITKRDVIDLLDKIADEGKPESAARVRAVLSKFFNWCVDRDIIPASPVPRSTFKQGKSRERVLADNEIAVLWRACDEVGYPFGRMVQMLLLLGQRRNEVAHAPWSEFALGGNDQQWLIPAARTKNGQEHSLPLPARAVGLLDGMPRISGYVFSTNGEMPVSGFSRAKQIIDRKVAAILKGDGADNLEPWTLHDLRRTAASGMARLGVAVHVVEAVLNHRSGSVRGVAAIYNRYDYAEEKRAALEAWAAHIHRLTV
ncbi:site-specific integrase [Rhizobium sp. EC-SD404]|uniref:tyrosine-type recombinase/integrase n=1 Tax=Rhizobium sp. EC-SD404 TaxID=2038389 RepID=UPI001257D611|nr:site-specific integrase [Rhizobium sp. EC-SD404]VVT04695.1 DNA integration/recombination/invertion protein [Rhizobium sp. EC-SD404]